MGSTGGMDADVPEPLRARVRPEPDPRADALRANLKRRKAQTRARNEARADGSQAPREADVPHGDG